MHDNELLNEAQKTEALTALAENFGKEFSQALLDMWLEMLGSYSVHQVKGAIRVVIERYEYKTMPPFAVIKKALDDLTGSSDKALELQALAEWERLLDLIGTKGSYTVPANLHPTTAYVVRVMGGWQQMCEWQTAYLGIKQREFVHTWMLANGKTEVMELGAVAVVKALAEPSGPVRISGAMLKEIAAGGVQ